MCVPLMVVLGFMLAWCDESACILLVAFVYYCYHNYYDLDTFLIVETNSNNVKLVVIYQLCESVSVQCLGISINLSTMQMRCVLVSDMPSLRNLPLATQPQSSSHNNSKPPGSSSAIYKICLEPYYEFERPGRYRLAL